MYANDDAYAKIERVDAFVKTDDGSALVKNEGSFGFADRDEEDCIFNGVVDPYGCRSQVATIPHHNGDTEQKDWTCKQYDGFGEFVEEEDREDGGAYGFQEKQDRHCICA